MIKKTTLPFLCVLVTAAAAVWIYRTQFGVTQRFDQSPYRALGYGVAEETAKVIARKGQVLVIAPDTSENPNPAVDSELETFQGTLKKNGIAIAATVRFKLAPQDRMATGGKIPPDPFLKT